MLKKQMLQYMEKLLEEKQAEQHSDILQLEVYKEEKEYIEKLQLLSGKKESIQFLEENPLMRFNDAYIERCNKESDELLAEESSDFLEHPINYFKNHKEEFMYLESSWFDIVGVDAISFEADSVFGTYDVMLGLRIPKKAEAYLKTLLSSKLNKEDVTYNLMFSTNDGLWELNFPLNGINTFDDEWTIREAFCAIYSFLFQLSEEVEESMQQNAKM